MEFWVITAQLINRAAYVRAYDRTGATEIRSPASGDRTFLALGIRLVSVPNGGGLPGDRFAGPRASLAAQSQIGEPCVIWSLASHAVIGRKERISTELMPRLLPVLLMIVALAGCSTTDPAVRGAESTAASTVGTAWRAEVLAVIVPLAERRLATGYRRGGVDHPLLPLGLDALGRASGEPRYAAAVTQARVTPKKQPPMAINDLCAGAVCRAGDLLHRPELWVGPGEGESGRSAVAGLEPAFRRMSTALFDREALLFRTSKSTTGESRAASGITGDNCFESSLNATAFAALTRMVEALPAEDPNRLEYVALYREMARTIIQVQGGDGWWRETLVHEAGPVDRSASALFVFGLTWGLNTGMLSFNEGETAALRGWNALRTPAGLEALQAADADLGALMLASAQMAERRW